MARARFPSQMHYCFGNNAAKEAFLKDPAANIAKAQETFSAPKE